jgi:hypothetical protein
MTSMDNFYKHRTVISMEMYMFGRCPMFFCFVVLIFFCRAYPVRLRWCCFVVVTGKVHWKEYYKHFLEAKGYDPEVARKQVIDYDQVQLDPDCESTM